MEGTITIQLEGASFAEVERCREIIMNMFEAGVFNVRNGKAILNFDQDAILQEVELQTKRFRKNKPILPEKKELIHTIT